MTNPLKETTDNIIQWYKQYGRVETTIHYKDKYYALVAEAGKLHIYEGFNNKEIKIINIK